jgi:hypothetical protein
MQRIERITLIQNACEQKQRSVQLAKAVDPSAPLDPFNPDGSLQFING